MTSDTVIRVVVGEHSLLPDDADAIGIDVELSTSAYASALLDWLRRDYPDADIRVDIRPTGSRIEVYGEEYGESERIRLAIDHMMDRLLKKEDWIILKGEGDG